MILKREKMLNSERIDFENGKPEKLIIKMAIPITISQLVNLLYSIVDRIYLGHIGNESVDILAGIGLVFPFIMIITAFSNMYGIGGGALFSIALGKKDNKNAELILNNCLMLIILTALILMTGIYLFKGRLLYVFGASERTYIYANQYISIYLIGTLFVMISLGMNNFINNQGFPQYGMMTICIGALLNIILDPLFIFVFGMKLKGAAIATVISQFCSASWIIHILKKKKMPISIKTEKMKLDFMVVKKVVSLGVSSFVMSITNAIVQIVYNAVLAGFGQEILITIMTIINSIREVVETPRAGITDGAKPVIGHAYGERNTDKVRKSVKWMSILCTLYCICVWGIIQLFPEVFLHLFTSDKEVLINGVIAVRLYFAGIFLMSLQHCGQSYFVGVGRTREAIFFSLFRKIVLVFPLVIILPKILPFGWKSIFIAEPISNLLGGTFCYGTMLYYLKKLEG